nr:alkaline phosphatase family protein [Saccharopolyspora flava]
MVAAGCSATPAAQPVTQTATPIQHVVVIFPENISFDHYFGTYPNAANTDGTPFTPAPGTPAVNGLNDDLLHHNPNAYQPKRLGPEHALTCDQDHKYSSEQKAVDDGKMDRFVEHTEHDRCTGQPVLFGEPGLVMDYFDGNTVTAMWNYAQHYAMSDNSFDSTYGPSTPGAINLVSGQTHGAQAVDAHSHEPVADAENVASPDRRQVGTLIEDPDPLFDECSNNNLTGDDNLARMQGRNVGDLLNDRQVTWGWFQSGFRPTGQSDGHAVCDAARPNVGGQSQVDYSPHHEPFQYYESTANPKHLPPSSVQAIGHTDQANHQYDMSDFHDALDAGNLPAVSYLKPPKAQDGHAGNSDPLDEQRFIVDEINRIQHSRDWASTAIVIAYDDSDGWYDHVAPPKINGSADPAEDVPGVCGGTPVMGGQQDRCGYGPRLPLLVISPYSKQNHVDHTLTDQGSVLRFIEDNWRLGRIGENSWDTRANPITGMLDFTAPPHPEPLRLDPATGAVSP